jgi:DNA-binding NtrC family response regulator
MIKEVQLQVDDRLCSIIIKSLRQLGEFQESIKIRMHHDDDIDGDEQVEVVSRNFIRRNENSSTSTMRKSTSSTPQSQTNLSMIQHLNTYSTNIASLPHLNILLIGEKGAGKSSVCSSRRFTHQTY